MSNKTFACSLLICGINISLALAMWAVGTKSYGNLLIGVAIALMIQLAIGKLCSWVLTQEKQEETCKD